jgi:cysteine-rich repeat protein
VHASVEECDDGNTESDDGCSSDCILEGECGDASGDGNVTVTDARQILLRTTDAFIDCPTAACDVNSSGFIDTSDALGTLQYAVGLYHDSVCKRPVRIVFHLASARTVGALQIALDYTKLPGNFAGEADQVDCTTHVDALASYNDWESQRQLGAGWIAMRGFTGPVDIASCIFERYGPRGAVTFEVELSDVVDPELNWMPNIVVTAEER